MSTKKTQTIKFYFEFTGPVSENELNEIVEMFIYKSREFSRLGPEYSAKVIRLEEGDV